MHCWRGVGEGYEAGIGLAVFIAFLLSYVRATRHPFLPCNHGYNHERDAPRRVAPGPVTR